MLLSIIEWVTAPRKLREAKRFLEQWCPKGVEVVTDGKACWLHYGGMVYSLDYRTTPEPQHVPYMLVHLEDHKWSLQLCGGVYTQRSLMEAWVMRFLPDACVFGFGPNDIVYPDEIADRPLLNGVHTSFAITHKGRFVTIVKSSNPLPWLTMELKKKTEAQAKGEGIYVGGNH